MCQQTDLHQGQVVPHDHSSSGHYCPVLHSGVNDFSFHQANNLVNAVQSFLPLSPVTRKVAALQTYKKAERFSALQMLVHSDSSIFMFTCTANCTDVHSWSAVLYFHVNSIITLNRPEYQLRMEHGNKISCICMCLCRPTSRRQ